jgi:hypothetical protein
MSKLILGSLLAALAMFVLGAVFWMSPLPYGVFSQTADDQAAGQALLQHFPESGNYYVPGHYNDAAKLESLHSAGPVAFVALHREGGPAMDPKYLGLGFLQYFVVMLLAGSILRRVGSALPTYGSRVWLVTLIGVIVGILGDLALPIWWRAPWPFFVVIAAYGVVSTMVGGLVLSKFVK